MKRLICVIAVCAMLAGMCSFCAGAASYDGLVDSGIDYTESTETFGNPMMGYPACISMWPRESGNTPRNDSGFVHYFIDMKWFSGGYTMVKANAEGDPIYDENGNYIYENGGLRIPLTKEMTAERVKDDFNAKREWAMNTRNTGGAEDKPLSEDAINYIRKTFENLRKNGGTCLVRPSYAINAEVYNEPYDFDMILTHAKQLSEIFTEYSDVVGGVEVGTIGPFGEMHTSPYCASIYSTPIIQTYLDNTPDSIKFMVRSPGYILNYLCGENGRTTQGIVYLKDGTKQGVMMAGNKSMVKLIPFDNLRDIEQDDMKRIAMYNDGYMLSWLDTGTWGQMSRSEGVKLLSWLTQYGYYGGEYGSGAYDTGFYDENGNQYHARYADGAWLPENALPEMYATHVSYIHGNVYRSTMPSVNTWFTKRDTLKEAEAVKQAWIDASLTITTKDPEYNAFDPESIKIVPADWNNPNGVNAVIFTKVGYDQIPFTPELAKMIINSDKGEDSIWYDGAVGVSDELDLSAYYYYSCYKFIRDHMGYRFVIRDSDLTGSVAKGGVLQIDMTVENTGMGNCVQDKVSQLVLMKDGEEVAVVDLNSAVDAESWISGHRTDFGFEVRLANTLEAGSYDAYLRICNVTQAGEPNTKTCVRFANNDIYNQGISANYVGSFEVTEEVSPFGNESFAQVTTVYDDVADDFWGVEAVESICSMGLMNGLTATTFGPNNTTTRGQFVTVLYRFSGSPELESTNVPFKDISAGSYYEDAVIWAYNNDIVAGTSDTTFSPGNKITREQFATMLYRYAAYCGNDVENSVELDKYIDNEKVSGWALEAMKWANAEEYITGVTATELRPRNNATRAQMATILMRYIKKTQG